MERGEKQTASSNQKKKIEPTFVPEWLKTTTTATGGGGSSNHIAGSSSYTDDHAAGILSRSRLPVNACELDNHRSSLIAERISSSYRRSSSTNGSLNQDKDTSLHSRPYSSFGRSNRDRDREKDVDFRDRKETIKLENGFQDLPDSFISSRSEKDALRRSQSLISGRQSDSWAKRPGNGTTNSNFLASGSIVNSISKASFDREFPSLGAEDKQGPPEIGRVSSPGLSSAIQILPLGCSALIGGDGWTSALAEVPVIVGGNGPSFSPVQQAATSTTSTVSSTTTGLNMAETLAQAPSRARAAPQVSVDSQKLEELAIKQSRQLIPVTPSMPKTSVLSSSEKLKPKGSRSGGDFGTLPKVGQQPVPQLVNHTLRGSNRPDISKPSQVGNFQVLNRERSGVSPTARDCPSATNISGALNPLGLVSAAATAPPLKTPNNLKLRVDGKATSLPVTTVAEKRPVTQQNRSEFFNSLRKKTSSSNATSIPGPTSYQLSTLEKSDEQTTGLSTSLDTEMKDTSSNSALDCSVGKSNGARSLDACKDSEDSPPCDGEKSCLDPAEEERLLRLFGWKENVGEEEEALTAEEIDAFLEEYQKLRPSSKFSRRNLLLANAALLETGDDGSGSGPTLSDSKSEGF